MPKANFYVFDCMCHQPWCRIVVKEIRESNEIECVYPICFTSADRELSWWHLFKRMYTWFKLKKIPFVYDCIFLRSSGIEQLPLLDQKVFLELGYEDEQDDENDIFYVEGPIDIDKKDLHFSHFWKYVWSGVLILTLCRTYKNAKLEEEVAW